MKQAYGSLLAEKNMLQKQLQHVNSSLESSKLKITSGEEQVAFYLCLKSFFLCKALGDIVKTSVDLQEIN